LPKIAVSERSMHHLVRRSRSPRVRAGLALLACLAGVVVAAGCHPREKPSGGYPVVDPNAECLPAVALTDQHGKQLMLSSLQGAPVLFDFIFTACRGPCPLLTQRMKTVAKDLGDLVGSKVRLVSLTVDPEHDGPSQLLTYAKQQGAETEGWSFLTGAPEKVDEVMQRFSLRRQREADGSVNHVTEFFLVGADGHPKRQYPGLTTEPATIAEDLRRAAAATGGS
jgi:protein SCO1/2